MRKEFKNYYLYFTVFITGAVILVLEILGTRIIAPYYGTTIYVWSSLITVTLLALALGYFFGGWLADKKPASDMIYLVIFMAGVFIALIPLIKNFVLIKMNVLGMLYGALASATILFTLPLLFLGMVAPYAIKLNAKSSNNIGMNAGSLYGVATIGSLIGAILIGFYLIPYIGINSIIFIISGLLFFISLIWSISKKKMLSTISLVLLFTLLVSFNFPIIGSSDSEVKKIYETNSAYARLSVIDENDLRFLLVDGATHTEYDLKNKEFNFRYLSLFEKAINYHTNPKEILVIGLGGGGIDTQLKSYNLNIDNIEIDSQIVEIAKNYFDFHGNVIIDDGRHYIRNSDQKYDVIYLDVYGGYSIYPYLFSKEAFQEIKNTLSEGGILSINSLGYEDGHLSSDDPLILSIYKTLKEVFPYVYVKSTGYGLTSFVFYASDNELELDSQFVLINVPNNGIVITDDYNPICSFAIESAKEWRKLNLERFGNNAII